MKPFLATFCLLLAPAGSSWSASPSKTVSEQALPSWERAETVMEKAAGEGLEEALKRVSTSSLAGFLNEISKAPHVAGSRANELVAQYIQSKFREYGLEVESSRYEVLLSYPEEAELELLAPSRAELLSLEGERLTAEAKAGLTREDLIPWNAYAPSGEVTATVVYANFGRPEDFEALARLGVEVKGRIVITRYGQGYRGGKTLEAEKRGAAAILFYSDPAQDGYAQGDAIPRGPWGPPDHFQRGSNVYDFIVPGDPLTPGWPSTQGARRIKPEESLLLPKIPSLPLSYRDASRILEALEGPVVPKGWQGGLPFTYHVGPGPAAVRLKVRNRLETRPILNVLGRLRGREEPEKTVFISSHHDAWTRGAMDDGLGTAAMLELARIFGELARQGKRPRRSVVFASWDAEEYTLTGSTEWGEEHAGELKKNAVGLLNIDAYRWGREFTAIAVPSLKRLILDSLGRVEDPVSGRSLLEEWKGGGKPEEPAEIGIMGSGSDYTVFLNHLGVPAVETMFTGTAGAYHSIYDDASWVERVDPGLKYLAALTRLNGIMALRLADEPLLPFDYAAYAREISSYLKALAKEKRLDLGQVLKAAWAWEKASILFEKAKGKANPGRLGCANKALMQVERDLLSTEGIPGRPWFKHLIYAPRPSYEALSLPGIREAAEAGDLARAGEQVKVLAKALRRAAATQASAADCFKK